MKSLTHLLPVLCLFSAMPVSDAELPNIVFVMADDMGWGQTGSSCCS